MLIIRTVGISTLNFLSRFKHGGCGKNLVNKSSMLGKDTIDFRLPAAHFAGKNHAMGTRSQAQVAGQFTFERFAITLFPLEISEGNPKFFSRLGSKTAQKINDLSREIDLSHASSAESGRNFVRPLS